MTTTESTLGDAKTRSISIEAKEVLDQISSQLTERGYIVLQSQWMKNPILHHYFVPICLPTPSNEVGVLEVAIHEDVSTIGVYIFSHSGKEVIVANYPSCVIVSG